jgi:hypothetical protein
MAQTFLQKCHTLGEPFIRVSPWTGRVELLYCKHGCEEKFEQMWKMKLKAQSHGGNVPVPVAQPTTQASAKRPLATHPEVTPPPKKGNAVTPTDPSDEKQILDCKLRSAGTINRLASRSSRMPRASKL